MVQDCPDTDDSDLSISASCLSQAECRLVARFRRLPTADQQYLLRFAQVLARAPASAAISRADALQVLRACSKSFEH
jgi:hypothetical protein